MKLKDIVAEDFVNYKKASMYLITPLCCQFKCCKEANSDICQNLDIVKLPTKEIENNKIISWYLSNPITKAVVIAGLEPLDTFEDTIKFIDEFRNVSCDDIVIYTGYNESEVLDKIEKLKEYSNIIIKFGRFIPNQESKFDDVLGVYLASPNQYARKIS